MRFLKLFLIISIFFDSFLIANEIETILKIKPPIRYSESQKYEEIVKPEEQHQHQDDKLIPYDVDIDMDINQEDKSIDKLKIDVGKTFKGIN